MNHIILATLHDRYKQKIKLDNLSHFFYFQSGIKFLSSHEPPSSEDYLKCALDDLLYIKSEFYMEALCVDKLSL